VALGTFAEAAAHGEMLFNCTHGSGSLAAFEAAGSGNMGRKVMVDIANPLDFSRGFPPSLSVCNTDSLAEQLQRAFPELRVVKALNTMNANVMVNPAIISGEHVVFVCGNDPVARAQVTALLQSDFGWQRVMDLGGLQAARGLEMAVMLWLSVMAAKGSPMFNFNVVG
jgi:predicted dinucleotide-binding enzyme